jgi:hypothetical protein
VILKEQKSETVDVKISRPIYYSSQTVLCILKADVWPLLKLWIDVPSVLRSSYLASPASNPFLTESTPLLRQPYKTEFSPPPPTTTGQPLYLRSSQPASNLRN